GPMRRADIALERDRPELLADLLLEKAGPEHAADLVKHRAPLLDDPRIDLVREARRGNARAIRIREHVDVIEPAGLDEVAGLFELFVGLAGKADDHVRAQAGVRDLAFDRGQDRGVVLRAVRPR